MANYENGANTKKLIISSARKLFYEKGFENTSIGDIAAASHVSKASILYHFKSKEGLFQHASCQALEELFMKTAKQLGLEKIEIILQYYIFWYKFYEDTSFRQYCIGGMRRLDVPDNAVEWTYQMLRAAYDFDDTLESFAEKNKLILKFAWDMEDNMVQYYGEHFRETTFEQVAELDAILFLRMLGVPDAVIQARIDDTKLILPSLDLDKMAAVKK